MEIVMECLPSPGGSMPAEDSPSRSRIESRRMLGIFAQPLEPGFLLVAQGLVELAERRRDDADRVADGLEPLAHDRKPIGRCHGIFTRAGPDQHFGALAGRTTQLAPRRP